LQGALDWMFVVFRSMLTRLTALGDVTRENAAECDADSEYEYRAAEYEKY